MQLTTAEERNRLLATCEREAVHLELRDIYAVHGEAERFATFVATASAREQMALTDANG